MVELSRPGKNGTRWYDTDIDGGEKYGYKIVAYADENISDAQTIILYLTIYSQ